MRELKGFSEKREEKYFRSTNCTFQTGEGSQDEGIIRGKFESEFQGYLPELICHLTRRKQQRNK